MARDAEFVALFEDEAGVRAEPASQECNRRQRNEQKTKKAARARLHQGSLGVPCGLGARILARRLACLRSHALRIDPVARARAPLIVLRTIGMRSASSSATTSPNRTGSVVSDFTPHPNCITANTPAQYLKRCSRFQRRPRRFCQPFVEVSASGSKIRNAAQQTTTQRFSA